MKKYDLILVALYVTSLLVLWGILNGYLREDIRNRQEMHTLESDVERADLKAVVIKNTDLNVFVRRVGDADRVAITDGHIRRTDRQNIRLSRDTLYISVPTGMNGCFVSLSVPDSVRVIISAAPNVIFEE